MSLEDGSFLMAPGREERRRPRKLCKSAELFLAGGDPVNCWAAAAGVQETWPEHALRNKNLPKAIAGTLRRCSCRYFCKLRTSNTALEAEEVPGHRNWLTCTDLSWDRLGSTAEVPLRCTASGRGRRDEISGRLEVDKHILSSTGPAEDVN